MTVFLCYSTLLHVMLDSNALDHVCDHMLGHRIRKAVDSKHIHLSITHVQTDEINPAPPATRECIRKLINDGYIKIVPTNGVIAGTDQPSKKPFIGSRFNMARFTSEKEANLLQNKMKINIKSSMKNSGDILILYTAIKQRMDFLVTDDKDVKKILDSFKQDVTTGLQVIDSKTFDHMLPLV
jgi:hypothetical protein